MKTKTINLYEILDLEKDSVLKARVIEKNRNINISFDNWDDCIIEGAKERLKELGYKESVIFYSGFYSQGDGACFTTDNIDLTRVIERMGLKIRLGLTNLLLERVERPNIIHRGNYYHEKSIDFSYGLDYIYLDRIYNYLDNLMIKIDNFISEEIIIESRAIYKKLEDYYEELQKDEAVWETLVANEYTFNVEGEIEC